MTQSLEDLKKRAREKFIGRDIVYVEPIIEMGASELDTLIEEVWNARTEECIKIIKDELHKAPLEVQMSKGVIFANVINRLTPKISDN